MNGYFELPDHEDCTLVGDRAEFAMLGGGPVDRLPVRRDLRRIFAFRQQRLAEIFGA